MRVGLTYDLRDDYLALGFSALDVAEFDSVETIDEIAGALQRLGLKVDRIGHVRALARRLVDGDRWDFVFNIAEGVKGRAREAQVPALLEAFAVPYVFSDPLTCAATLDKAVAKRLVRDAGLPTALFAVVERSGEEALVDVGFPAFVKPLAEGTGKGCERSSKVENAEELSAAVRSLIERFDQPVIVEPFLPGREFTVGIVGNGAGARAIGVLEITLVQSADAAVYSFVNKEECEARVGYSLASDGEAQAAADLAVAAYRTLGCRDAARLDFRSDGCGQPQFLEANPLAGLHPRHSDLPILAGLAGMSYDALMGSIIDAACARIGLKRRRSRQAA